MISSKGKGQIFTQLYTAIHLNAILDLTSFQYTGLKYSSLYGSNYILSPTYTHD